MDEANRGNYKFNNSGNKVDMSKFNYLNKSNCYEVPTVDDNEFYSDTCESFLTMGFSKDEITAIWKMLSAVLNLGNSEVTQNGSDGEQQCQFEDSVYFKNVIELLGVDQAELVGGMTLQVSSLYTKNRAK